MANEPFEFSDNPYQAPQAEIGAVEVTDLSLAEAERIRREHLKHEVSVKGIGYLYLLGAIAITFGAVAFAAILLNLLPGNVGGMDATSTIVLGVYAALMPVYWAAAIGLIRLLPWSRWVAAILAALGLMSFPCGTLISVYVLYLLLSAKGRVVFSPEYREIIRKTPHIKYKSSVWAIVLLLVLVAAIVAIIAVAL